MAPKDAVAAQETISRALKHLETLDTQIERDRTMLIEKRKELADVAHQTARTENRFNSVQDKVR